MSAAEGSDGRLEVVIGGGGVAALEAVLALRSLAGDRVALRLIASGSEFVYRPMTVREPLSYARAARYPIDGLAEDVGAELLLDTVQSVDGAGRTIRTASGTELHFDALVLALGARPHARYEHAITLDDRRLDEQLHGLVQDLEGGYLKRLALVIPPRMAWPLPIYDLAMLMATRADDMNVEVAITILTPEDDPLQVFGERASETVRGLLEERGIEIVTGAYSEVSAPGRVDIGPGDRSMEFDRIIALPELEGPRLQGVPGDAEGFIPIDAHCQVQGLERVYAAGDGTDFPVKHGGIAAQQADAAASAIARLAGADVEPELFEPVIHGVLLTGGQPRYLSAHITGGHGEGSKVSTEPTWEPATKITARYLAPYLEQRES